MYKYKSKCRWNMLLYVDNIIIEIRPNELFESKTPIESRFLDLLSEPQKKKTKVKEDIEWPRPLQE